MDDVLKHRRATDLSGVPTDDLVRQFIQRGMDEMSGLRHDVQDLHGSIKDVFGEMKHISEDQKEDKAERDKLVNSSGDHDRRLTALETRVIVIQWVFTILIPIAAILAAMWPRK